MALKFVIVMTVEGPIEIEQEGPELKVAEGTMVGHSFNAPFWRDS